MKAFTSRHRSRRQPAGQRVRRRIRGARLRLEPLEERVLLASFAVLNTNDGGAGSLRQAILDADATPNADGNGDGVADPDVIAFNIPGAGVKTISPASALPLITQPVIIDGYTQPGSVLNTHSPDQGGTNAVLLIEIDGAAVDGNGLEVTGGGSTIRGLAVNRFQGNGIVLRSSGNLVIGNFIGTGPAGDADLGNGASGVRVLDSDGNVIGGDTPADRNLISGNSGAGVFVVGSSAPADGTLVLGNLIGTDRSGTAAIGNGNDGVHLERFSFAVTGAVIGGTTAGARNVISGNRNGVEIVGANGNRVEGNLIGTDVTGSAGLPNAGSGVSLPGSLATLDNTIRGNVISGNRDQGIQILGQSSGTRVLGNFIGTNAAGTAALANPRGLLIVAGGNTIGAPGEGNLISGNSGNGIQLSGNSTASNLIQSNRIGTDASGTRRLGNGQAGVLFEDGASNNLVGGTDADDGAADGVVAAANLIAFNGLSGVHSSGGTDNRFLGNSILANGRLGIDLGGFNPSGDGVTTNDDGDGDDGPNHRQNFPVITAADRTPTATVLHAILNSTPDRGFRVEFFASTAAAGSHAGQTLLGAVTVHTGGDGNTAAFTLTATGDFRDRSFTATATDLTTGDTSEFSKSFLGPDLVVTTTADVIDPTDGVTSLREAILNANDTFFFPGADAITFDVPADDPGHLYYRDDGQPGRVSRASIATTDAADDASIADIDPDWPQSWFSIRPNSALPILQDTATIDGYSQPGSRPNTAATGTNALLRIELDGTSAGGNNPALGSGSGGAITVQGLVINRFASDGLFLGTSGSLAKGNFIGTDVSGSLALGNEDGIRIAGSAGDIVGGPEPAARNLISGNRADGVALVDGGNFSPLTNDHRVVGNLIGTARDGISPLGNGGSGVVLATGARPVDDNDVEANTIAFNGRGGVVLHTGGVGAIGELLGNHFLANASFGNIGLGIDLDADGVTANDAGDGDAGINNRQNFPVLAEVVSSAVGATVFGSLNSTPRTQFLIQYYSDTAADPSGFGEGRTFLGEAIVQTDSAGNVSFAAPLPAPIPDDRVVSATATRLLDDDGDPATPPLPRETSEFSRAIPAATPELHLGETLTPDLAPGQELRFRLSVPVGSQARLRVSFSDPRLGEVFVRQGALPGTEAFGFHALGFLEPNPVFLLSGSPVPYFLTLDGTATAAVPAAGVTLTAEAAVPTIDRVTPDHGGNVGTATATIVGTDFSAATTFSLVSAGGVERAASGVTRRDETTFFATFDLNGLDPGAYDVRATDGASSFVAAGAFTVTAGTPGEFRARIVAPSVVSRRNGGGTLVVEYQNVGDTDIPAPVVVLASQTTVVQQIPRIPAAIGAGSSSGGGGGAGNGAVFITEPVQPSPEPRALVPRARFLAIGEDGPAGVLPPGAYGRVEVHFADDGSLDPAFHPDLDFTLIVAGPPDRPFDLTASKDAMRPASVSPEAWDVVFANLLAQVGTTVGSYTRALDDAATYLSRFGLATDNIDRLLSLLVEQADGALPGLPPTVAVDATAPAPGVPLVWGRSFAPTISRRFDLGILGRGWSSSWDVRLSIDPGTQQVLIRTPVGTRRFAPQDDGRFVGGPGEPGTLSRQGDQFLLLDPDGTLDRFDAASGDLLAVEDRNGNRVTLAYTAGRLTGLIHSDGDRFTLHYNAQGRLDRLVDQAGRVTSYEYDAAGEHLLRVTGPAGTTSYTYNTVDGTPQEHALASVGRADGTHLFLGYDAQGRLARVEGDGGTSPASLGYGRMGEVFVTDAAGATTTYSFDETGRLLAIRDPLDRAARFEYDADGRLDRLTLPGDTISLFDYDAGANLTHLVMPDGTSLSNDHDVATGAMTAVRDERGNVIRYTLDGHGNPTRIVHPDGTTEQFAFDAAGNVTRTVNRSGLAITYTYDARGLLVRKDHADGTFEAFTYDARGNRLTATDEHGTTATEYDAADRLIRVVYPDGRSLSYTYDAGGRRTRLEDQDGFAVNDLYDAAGRLDRLTDRADALIVAYTYDAAGRLSSETHGNATTTSYTYDRAGRLESLVHRLPDGSVSSRFDYSYDDLGRRTSMTTLEGTTSYGYDAIGQLTSVSLPNGRSIRYEYDDAGNRVAVVDDGVRTEYLPDAMNRYAQVGDTTRIYDDDGNLIRIEDAGGQAEASYTYDDEGRLIAYESGGTSVQYEYDALGLRVARVENGVRTEYLPDLTGLTRVVAEYDADGAAIARYAYGASGLVSRHDASGDAGFYDFDAVGSTVALTDASGSVADRYSYLPFGESLARTETIANPFEYVGQLGVQRDADGLDFMRSRYYTAADGRFLSEDPIGVAGGLNFYRYAGNQPTRWSDPTGLQPWLPAPVSTPFFPGSSFPASAGTLTPTGSIIGGGAEQVAALEAFESAATNPEIAALTTEVLTDAGAATTVAEGGAVAAGSGGAASGGAGGFILAEALPPVAIISAAIIVGYIGANSASGQFYGDLACDLVDCDDPDWDVPAPPGDPSGDTHVRQVGAFDPNDLVGPQGFGAGGFVPADATLPYTLHFENLAAATAPAQTVTVTEQLDPDLDFRTFQFVDFGLGAAFADIPAGRTRFTARYDLRAQGGVFLDVDFHLNVQTGVVTWQFTSIDPATLELPDDPLTGFLPPNQSPPTGEGSVSYLVRPRAGLPSGTRIDARASVVFDTNPPIDTPAVFNTLDAGAPTSAVHPLPATTGTTSFPVSWSGSDDPGGSGVARFDVLVSTDGGPFTPFLTRTTATSATFNGSPGHTYAFSSVATDHVGRVQPTPSAAQAVTRISTSDTTPPASQVGPLPATTPWATFTVNWSGNDAGGTGIASYDVYVSTDGGPFAAFRMQTLQTSAAFTGAYGHSYAFLSVATDHAGNRQPTAGSPPATTHVPSLVTVRKPSFVTVKLGSGKRARTTTGIRIPFSGDLDPARASSLSPYHLLSGKVKKGRTTFKSGVPLSSAIDNAPADSVTLIPRGKLNLKLPLRLTIAAALLTDTFGRPIDGDLDGQPGGDAVATSRGHSISITSGAAKTTPTLRRATRAFDHILCQGIVVRRRSRLPARLR